MMNVTPCKHGLVTITLDKKRAVLFLGFIERYEKGTSRFTRLLRYAVGKC